MLTIITANANRDLTTLAAVKSDLGITDVASDAKLSSYITQASNIIAEYCNRVFAIETVQETFRIPAGSADIMLSRYPITEVVSVDEGATTLINTGFEINSRTGIVDRLSASGCVMPWQTGLTTIIYKAGFTLPDGLPDGIERGCIQLVKQMNASGDRDPMVREESDEGVGSTGYFSGSGSGLPPEVEGLISMHRRPNA